MNEKDLVTLTFMEDNERFADVMNVGVFQGKTVLRTGQLKNVDSSVGSILGKRNRKISVHKYRDLMKKSTYGVNFVLIGVENQTDIHYAMPVQSLFRDFRKKISFIRF